LLGIDPTATPRQVASAYRRRLRESDHAVQADLGPELQQLAEDRATRIQSAFQAFEASRRDPDRAPPAPDVARVWETHKPTRS
jgi:hypothetical protein